jgi:hypothetical protein
MMQEEVRITRASKQIATWVATNGKVTSSVHAQKAIGEISLHGV